MVIKTELCTFSEWRIYPGHGSRYVAKDGRLSIFISQKSKSLSLRKIKNQQIQWTVAWRRLNKKIKTDEGQKKKRKRNLKVQRAIVGISLEEIRRQRKLDDKTRKAQAEQAAREIKERQKKTTDTKSKGLKSQQQAAKKAETKAAKGATGKAPAQKPAAAKGKGGR